ncbi:MAG: hypothetical protein ACRD0Z_16195 [Acidimicrobiales bacterium]
MGIYSLAGADSPGPEGLRLVPVAALGSTRMWLFGIATKLIAKHWRAERRRLAAYAAAGGRAESRGASGARRRRLLADVAAFGRFFLTPTI